MIRHSLIGYLLVILALTGSPGSAFAKGPSPVPAPASDEFVIYTYDSFVAKHGLGPEIFPRFEKKCGCKIKALPSGDGAQLLTRLQLDHERGRSAAQVILGIDQNLWEKAKSLAEPWGDWVPKEYAEVIAEARVEKGFLPFDYGVMAFMSDMEQLKALKLAPPKSLSDLKKPEWKRNLVLEDPRTSTPGLGFLLYTTEVFGDGAWDFWKSLKTQWLTLAPGWDGAYGLFLKKEAPMVWSYTSSQAYHEENGDRAGRYRAVVFEEGNPIQIEGAALVKDGLRTPQQRARARLFLEFLLSPEIQAMVPSRNWMLPVMPKTPVPASFSRLPRPRKVFQNKLSASQVDQALAKWAQTIR